MQINLLLFPDFLLLFQQNHLRRLTKFPNTSRRILRKKTKKKLYAQAFSFFTNSTRETKEVFSNLQNKKIKNIQKITSNKNKPKLKFNITMKRLSRKQIIILMNIDNKIQFIEDSSAYITNINRALKSIKSKVVADFACLENSGIVITTNKVAVSLNLQTTEQYVKNVSYIEADNVEAPRLSQSKLYLKILGISYLLENSNTPISADVVEKIIKDNYIFNNIVIVSRPRVIKVSPKLDMAII